jgi:hypothetical protein
MARQSVARLRHDPMMAMLAGKLAARREDCAPVAGKSTLILLELSKLEPPRYLQDQPQFDGLLVDLFVEAHERAPKQMILDLDATDGSAAPRAGGAVLPYVFCGRHLSGPPGVIIGVRDEAVDGGLEIDHATEDTALQSLLGKFSEEPLVCVEPRARGWREVEGKRGRERRPTQSLEFRRLAAEILPRIPAMQYCCGC